MGMITDIQRFSLKDGPGIRSTIFFKGCNAACRWCHNPETLSPQQELLIYPDRCMGCGACVDFEPQAGGLPPPRETLSLERAGRCFSGALQTVGVEMDVSQVMNQVEQDRDYYRDSGGGVTLSGGEVMIQAPFAAGILRACREKGIAAAIETNLAYDYSLLEDLLPDLDLVMADIKLLDTGRHRFYTGIGNEEILANVKRLARAGLPYILRTPVVPGVNDKVEEIGSIAEFIAGDKEFLLYYELLNYNPLGASKYEGLGVSCAHRGSRPLSGERMEELV
ncbi:MAG: glycyl-radical enzyme activating protein, partial [Treponema sp.]|nr:glycyl-radical enzyme activating protein [Treponema sp.]